MVKCFSGEMVYNFAALIYLSPLRYLYGWHAVVIDSSNSPSFPNQPDSGHDRENLLLLDYSPNSLVNQQFQHNKDDPVGFLTKKLDYFPGKFYANYVKLRDFMR